MTVKELIEKLQELPDDATILVNDNCGGGYILRDVEYLETFNEVELS